MASSQWGYNNNNNGYTELSNDEQYALRKKTDDYVPPKASTSENNGTSGMTTHQCFSLAILIMVSILLGLFVIYSIAWIVVTARGTGSNSTGIDKSMVLSGSSVCQAQQELISSSECGLLLSDTVMDQATFCTENRVISSLGCSSVGPCTPRIIDFETKDASLLTLSGNNRQISINTEEFYLFHFIVGSPFRCPKRKIKMAVVETVSNKTLGEFDVDGRDAVEVCFSEILAAGSRVSIVINNPASFLQESISISGSVMTTGDYAKLKYYTNLDLTANVMWIPQRPNLPGQPPQYPTANTTYPWLSPVIPSEVQNLTNPQAVGLPNNNGYNKFRSVPDSLNFYLGVDVDTIPSNSRKISVFLTNRRDRGIAPSNGAQPNYRKEVYMSALTSGVMPLYEPKMDAYINEIEASMTTYGDSVLSANRRALVRFFLAIHLGEDAYPDYVVEYFNTFIDIIGEGNPLRAGRDAAYMRGRTIVDDVYAYTAKRLEVIKANRDVTSMSYHWYLAGLDGEGLVMECVHNIIAFSQFNHAFFLAIKDQLNGTTTNAPSPLPSAIKHDFLGRYRNATSDAARINIIREFLRLTLPNGVTFRDVTPKDSTNTDRIKARIVHQGIQATADATAFFLQTNISNPARYIQYDTSRYNAFTTDFSETSCPFATLGLLNNDEVATRFTRSPVDGETVVDKCNPKMQPVFPLPLYAPFGLGGERCPGEIFSNVVIGKLFTMLCKYNYVFRPITPSTPTMTLAPFTVVPDNIYVLSPAV